MTRRGQYFLLPALLLLMGLAGCTSSPSTPWVEEPFQTIKSSDLPTNAQTDCQVLVVGGGTGGTAAALAAVESGATVCITEETAWLGGQFTAQGLGCCDDNAYMLTDEMTTISSRFRLFRSQVRSHYRGVGNPGGAWLSFFSAEPRSFVDAIAKMTEPYVTAGKLSIYLGVRPVAVIKDGNKVVGMSYLRLADGVTFQVTAGQVIDATELGDVIKLSGAAYRVGQEPRSDTGEADAPVLGNPAASQAITYCVALEKRPSGENHTIAKPQGYGEDAWMKGFTLSGYSVFNGDRSFYGWRRIRNSRMVGGKELAVINWSSGNDYWFGNILDAPADEMELNLERARLRTLGFVYWLQTEAEGQGFPNLKIDTEAFGTASGLAMTPYIRESRRLRALDTIHVEDVSNAYRSGPRARNWQNSLGIGQYDFDFHKFMAPGSGTPRGKTLPYQIPLGSLIPETLDGLLAGAKNLGTTHLTSSAYRTHPTEWAIGEAAGSLASFCVARQIQPRDVFASEPLTRQLQNQLLAAGVPLYWAQDVQPRDADWQDIQLVQVADAIPGIVDYPGFLPDASLSRADSAVALAKVLNLDLSQTPSTPSFPDVPVDLPAFPAIEACYRAGYLYEVPGANFVPEAPINIGYVDQMVYTATGTRLFASRPFADLATRRQAANGFATILRHRVNP